MARDDDGGRGKPKGTLAIDIRDMDLDGEDPPPKSSRGRSSERGSSREHGRSRNDEPSRGGDSGGRRRPSGGFGDSGDSGGGGGKGTLAMDLSSLDLDDDDDGRGSSQSSRPGRSGAAWGGDDPPARDRSSSRSSRGSGQSSSQSRGQAPGGRRVEEWDDESDDRLGDYEGGRANRATRPSAGISEEDLARALPPKVGHADATTSINLADAPVESRQASARLTFRAGQAAEPVQTFDKDVIRVGREVDNDIILLDAQSSRYHFELRRRGSSFELKDLDSGNGSFVNGHRVKRVTLTEGAVLRVGDTELVFELIQPGVAGPRGGLSSKATEAAEAQPAPEAAPAVDDGGEDVDPATDDLEPPKMPMEVIAAMAAVGLLAFVFVSLLLVFLLTGEGDKPKKGNRIASAAATDSGGSEEPELPPAVLVGPALSSADKAYGAGDWMTARGHVQVVLTVDPGNKRAKQFLGRVDRALQTEDSSALRVTFDPSTAKRGKPLAIRVRLELPARELRATFMGRPVELTLSPDVPREYVGEVVLPKKMKKGEQELDVEITDFLEGRFEFARRVNVR